MAPARRKGLGRASAEASAMEWKIGDLVLAKMKGFPAWPAVIHDPKRWGYPSNRKKLLVFFFGTKQIAFCNHVDLQAFTDERKKTLLNKRQSKGGDFSRAVREIVECYDNLQKQKCDNHFNLSDEGAVLDTKNLENSSCRFYMRSTDIIQSQRCDSLIQNSGMSKLEDTLQSGVGNDDYVDTDQPSEKVSITDELRQTHFASKSSFKRVRKTLSQSCKIQKKIPSIRKSRSLTKADSSFKLQACDIRTDKLDLSDITMICNVAQDELAVRNKLSKESLDNSVCKNVDIHSLLTSETAHDDILPEIISSNSKKGYLGNDGLSEVQNADENSLMSCPDKSNKMAGRAGNKRMKVVVKKTKKSHNSSLSCCSMEETKFKVVNEDLSNSVHQCKNITERFTKVGHSDEHLPLVKRARVRMGEASLGEKQFDIAIKTPGEASIKTEKVDAMCSDKDGIPISDFSFKEPLALDATKLNTISSSNDCTESKLSDASFKVAPYPFRVISIDSEAALPPSKRLNRALEAMSANVAEAKDDATKAVSNNGRARDIWNEVPEVLEVVSNGFTNSSTVAPFIPLDNKNVCPQEMQEKCSNANSVVNATYRSPLHPSLEIQDSMEISSGLIPNDCCLGNRITEEAECTITSAACSPIHSSSAETNKAEVFIPEPCLSDGIDKPINDTSCSNTIEISSPTIKCERNIAQPGMDIFDKASKGQGLCSQVCEEIDRSHSDSPKLMVESCTVVPQNSLYMSIPATSSQTCSETNKSVHSDTQELKVDNSMVFPLNNTSGSHAVAVERSMPDVPENAIFPSYGCKAYHRENEMKLSATEFNGTHTTKDLVFSPDFCLSKVSNPNNATVVKLSSDILSSPSPLFTEDSSERLSSHSEKTNYQYSSNNSPNVNIQLKNSSLRLDIGYAKSESFMTNQQKLLTKSSGSNEANAALKYFDGLVCALTRAKDSIGRATQCAIDCSKLFVSNEVVEILLRHLEKEQSLHRKIDMFFLADSIIRYSRGQKDIAGDEYPSLFQSVLGRLIASAAPPGISSWENRRQCLKVLKLWLDRKTFSESILRHHIRALESINEEPFNNVFCRRLLRRERPLDDPAREMEGMLVDEYGSNTSFELPGLLNSQIFKDMDDGSDSDEKIFEAVTPEHDHKINENNNTVSTSSNMTGQRKRILEDVDGELEMEDVAPLSDHAVDVDRHHHPLTFTPPLPNDKPPSPPPLPSSPPPNMQIHIQPSNTKLIEQNIQKASSSSDAATLPYYTPGYRDHPNHIPPHSSLLSLSCTYGNNNSSSHLPSVQCIKNPQLVNATPMKTTAYHLRPPLPPEVSSQFSYMPPDPHRNIQPWFGNDRHVGNDYSDRIRMMQQHESCDYSSSVLPGHLPSESTEPSCSISYYGPPHNSSLMPNWPHPPQESNYRYPQPPLHRPMENHLPRKARAPAFWRP